MIDEILEDLGLPVNSSPRGYNLGYDLRWEDTIWLERLGGIAGRAREFRLCTQRRNKSGGTAISEPAKSKCDIKRILLEWMTGEQKPERLGYTFYARRHRYKGNDSVIWCYKKIRSPKSGKKQ